MKCSMCGKYKRVMRWFWLEKCLPRPFNWWAWSFVLRLTKTPHLMGIPISHPCDIEAEYRCRR